jgi:hypothetical protein
MLLMFKTPELAANQCQTSKCEPVIDLNSAILGLERAILESVQSVADVVESMAPS